MARIVHADDYQMIRELIRDALNHNGHEALPAENGREALDLIHKGGIDLLITDGQMPKMDGFELIAKLGAEGQTMPILVFSGLQVDDLSEERIANIKKYRGQIIYGPKPANEEFLRPTISMLLRNEPIAEYGVYVHGVHIHDSNQCATMIRDILLQKGHTVINGGCLCAQEKRIAKIAICHPDDTKECLVRTRRTIEENPQTQFYVIAMGTPERQQQIERHHNLTYITHDNAKQIIPEILGSANKL